MRSRRPCAATLAPACRPARPPVGPGNTAPGRRLPTMRRRRRRAPRCAAPMEWPSRPQLGPGDFWCNGQGLVSVLDRGALLVQRAALAQAAARCRLRAGRAGRGTRLPRGHGRPHGRPGALRTLTGPSSAPCSPCSIRISPARGPAGRVQAGQGRAGSFAGRGFGAGPRPGWANRHRAVSRLAFGDGAVDTTGQPARPPADRPHSADRPHLGDRGGARGAPPPGQEVEEARWRHHVSVATLSDADFDQRTAASRNLEEHFAPSPHRRLADPEGRGAVPISFTVDVTCGGCRRASTTPSPPRRPWRRGTPGPATASPTWLFRRPAKTQGGRAGDQPPWSWTRPAARA